MVLIPDLEDGMAYTSFLNGLKSGRFKLSLAEQKDTTLVEALRKAADFIGATEICADNSNTPKKAWTLVEKNPNCGDRNHGPRERRSQLEVVDPRFITDLRSIHMRLGDIPCSGDHRQ